MGGFHSTEEEIARRSGPALAEEKTWDGPNEPRNGSFLLKKSKNENRTAFWENKGHYKKTKKLPAN